MLRQRDPRGWLHLFDDDAIKELQHEFSIPPDLLDARPVLKLAGTGDSRLRPALLVERRFWQDLDRLRIRIYRAALRPYALAIGRERISDDAPLPQQHAARIACGQKILARNPISAHGLDRLIAEARSATAALIQPDLLQWLPDALPYFKYLEEV
jgi:hypothetical protein